MPTILNKKWMAVASKIIWARLSLRSKNFVVIKLDRLAHMRCSCLMTVFKIISYRSTMDYNLIVILYNDAHNTAGSDISKALCSSGAISWQMVFCYDQALAARLRNLGFDPVIQRLWVGALWNRAV